MTPNDTTDSNNFTATDVQKSFVLTIGMSVLGVPGNVLVIAVYIMKMTSSTRVYMFALAVADLAVCISGIGLAMLNFDHITEEVLVFSGHMSLTFSMMLLAFVSLERLMAVRRPHTFSLCVHRAKRALLVIAAAAALTALVLTVARANHNRMLLTFLPAFVILGNSVVMIFSYTLMAVTLLMRAMHVRATVHAASKPSVPSCSTALAVNPVATKPESTSERNICQRNSRTKQLTTKHGKTAKDITLLFIITVVFFVCWLPHWLSESGLDVPKDVRRIYILNSVVNPFIYSAVSRMFRDDVRQFNQQMRSKLLSCCK